jgi:hypothetical protein
MSGDAPSQPSLATPPARNQRLTHFPFDASAMENGGAIRTRHLLEEYAWFARTIGARASQWKCYRMFSAAEGKELAPVTDQQLVAYVGWLAQEHEAGRRSASAGSLPQYITAARTVARSQFGGDAATTTIPLLSALQRAYSKWEEDIKIPESGPSRRRAGRYCPGHLVARHAVAGTKRCSRRRCRSSGLRSRSPRVVAAVSARRNSDVGRAQSNATVSSCQEQSAKAFDSEQLSALCYRLAFPCRFGGAMGRYENRTPAILRPARRANGVAYRWFVCCIATLPCSNILLSSGRQHVVLTLFAYWCSYRAHAAWTTC